MGEQVEVAKLPNCDLCDDGTLAQYDGRTRMGPWAYMCEDCWRSYGVGRLGTGFGQRLVVKGD